MLRATALGVLAEAGGVCEAPRPKAVCGRSQARSPSRPSHKGQGRWLPHALGWDLSPHPTPRLPGPSDSAYLILKALGLAGGALSLQFGLPAYPQHYVPALSRQGSGGRLGTPEPYYLHAPAPGQTLAVLP